MKAFLDFSNYLLFWYYLASNLIYLGLLLVSVRVTIAHHHRLAGLWLDRMRASSLIPPVSILVPAHNEEKCIVNSVKSFLALDYPELEVIVINDGSSDGTLRLLKEHFRLLRTDILYVSEIPTKPVRGLYMSAQDRRLLVIDKFSSGRKADALNAGLNAASSPFVCAVDADAVLEKDSLLRIMIPVFADPRRVVATGGIVRVVNGTVIENGDVKEVRLPRQPLAVLQVIEYLRSFLIGRQGWAEFNLLILISGAFGVFRRDVMRQVGGFRPTAIGEDLDLVVRIHRHLREKKEDYRVAFVPDPVCWTEVPSNLKSLARQRARWQNGLSDVLWRNLDMLFNPRFGRIGFLAFPYHWLFEWLAPVIELLGWSTMIIAAVSGQLSPSFFLAFLLFGYLFGTLISIGSVVLEEMTYHRYNDWRDLVRLLAFCFFEFFPYRPLNTLWRLRGLRDSLKGRNAWTRIERVGFAEQAEAGR
jgi:cellulose synthase/poly-beta-1,6-N-acetylglucosamine synthase-like glycosyltransferase